MLMSLFSGVSLALASAGIFGVLAYAVAQRSNEIGIRIALGASRRDVLSMVLGQGVRLAAIGIACGLVAAVALTRLIASLLFDVKAIDPITYLTVALGLVGAAALASVVPALQATSVDPVLAKSPRPPKVIVPSESTETRRPERPSSL